MDVTQGSPDNGPLAALNGSWVLARDAATGRFARRFSFALPTSGLADGMRWQPDTGFRLSFAQLEYDARDASAPEGVTLQNSGANDLKLIFPVPRRLWRIKLSGALGSDTIEARRFDGDAVTEDAFASASHGSSGAELDATDRQLLLRGVRAGVPFALRADNVQDVLVRSSAANVRVGVVLPALGSEVFLLGPDAGAVLSQPTSATQLGPALALLLQGACDRLAEGLEAAPLPTPLALTLVIESDTPARAQIEGFVLRYRLSRRRFADTAPKRVLEFGGGALVEQPLAIDVPHGSALWSATLRTMGAFHEPAEGEGEDDAEEPDPSAAAQPAVEASDLGVSLRQGQAAASRLVVEQALLVRGAVVELVGQADASAGQVRLQADASGLPGEVLGEAALAPLGAGEPRTVRVDFDRVSLLGAGPVWIALQCSSGALLWRIALPSDATADRQLVRRAAGEVVWTNVAAAADCGAVAALVPASVLAEASGAAADDRGFHGVRLLLGGARLRGRRPAPGSAGEQETRFSLAAALAPLVQSAAPGSLVPVSLAFRSGERGRVTVYPPEFEFDP